MFLSFEIMWLPWVSGVLALAGNACPIKCKLHAKNAIRKYLLKSGQIEAVLFRNQTTKRHNFE